MGGGGVYGCSPVESSQVEPSVGVGARARPGKLSSPSDLRSTWVGVGRGAAAVDGQVGSFFFGVGSKFGWVGLKKGTRE